MSLPKVYENVFRIAELRNFWVSPFNHYYRKHRPDFQATNPNRIREKMNRIFTQWAGEITEEDWPLMETVENHYRFYVDISEEEEDVEEVTSCLQQLSSREIFLTNLLYVHHVFSEEDKQIKVDYIKIYVYYLNVLKKICQSVTSILITSHDLTPTSNNQLRYMDIPFVIFKESNLTFLPIDHNHVPKHELLTNVEKSLYLEQVSILPDRNMYIQSDDPIVKFYGWNHGDIIKITRDYDLLDFPASKCISYRTVIKR